MHGVKNNEFDAREGKKLHDEDREKKSALNNNSLKLYSRFCFGSW